MMHADCRIKVEGKWDGISTLNNFSFDKDGKNVTVWKSYDIGKGKEVKWSKLPGMFHFTFVQVRIVNYLLIIYISSLIHPFIDSFIKHLFF